MNWHQALAGQGRLLTLDEPDKGLEVHVVPIGVREDVPLDLCVGQSYDHLLCVADVSFQSFHDCAINELVQKDSYFA